MIEQSVENVLVKLMSWVGSVETRLAAMERGLITLSEVAGERLRDHDLDIAALHLALDAESAALSDLQAEVTSIDRDRLKAREGLLERLAALESKTVVQGAAEVAALASLPPNYTSPNHIRGFLRAETDILGERPRYYPGGQDERRTDRLIREEGYHDANRGDFER